MFQKRPEHDDIINILNYIELKLIQKVQTEETIKTIEACNLLLSYFTQDINKLN
jgi:hypothetical protein